MNSSVTSVASGAANEGFVVENGLEIGFRVVGRGRGVNRTVQNPLEVHVLADVAVPLVCDRLTSWDVE